MKKYNLTSIVGSILVGLLIVGTSKQIYLNHPINILKRNKVEKSKMFKSGTFQGYEAFAGQGIISGEKVAKIYGPIMKDSKGNYFYDMIAAVDVDKDGEFQVKDLVKSRSKYFGDYTLVGDPAGELSSNLEELYNPKSLEEVYKKVLK